ncbi:recombinase XerD, partial [Massilia sp. TW-1]|nr:recombinase XerD [Telluria antibiotica]
HVSIEHLRAIHDATHPARLRREDAPDAPRMPEAAGQAWLDALADEANDD